METEETFDFAIIGGGAAGVLLALRLLRDGAAGQTIALIEPGEPGRGVAYGTDDPAHVLNVGAGNMSADADTPDVVDEGEGVWLMEGGMLLEEVWEALHCPRLPCEEGYHTLAGLVLNQLGQIPHGGEQFTLGSYQFTVVSMDGHRVHQVRVRDAHQSADAQTA